MQREIEAKNEEIKEKDLAVVELSAALDVMISKNNFLKQRAMGGVLSEFLNDMKVEDGNQPPLREDEDEDSDVELYHG